MNNAKRTINSAHFSLLALILTGLLLSAAKCEDPIDGPMGCTEMGCNDMLTMELTLFGGEYEAGAYAFTVSPEGFDPLTLDCEIEAGTPFDNCSGEFEGDLFLHATGNGEIITLYLESGWGQLQSATVGLDIEIDEQQVVQDEITPEWTENYPNGEQCDEVPCYQHEIGLGYVE